MTTVGDHGGKTKSFGSWTFKGCLGSGGFGFVHHWHNLRTGQEIAIKGLKDHSTMGVDEIEVLKNRWLLEYKWTRELDTDYIVRGISLSAEHNAFISYLNDNHGWPLPVIILEYCNAGDIRSHLQRPENANGLPEFQIRQILHTLRQAINFLHEKYKIFHRDLKPDNIVCHQLKNGKKIYKLTDFGFARHDLDHTAKQSVVGTRHYLAPEIIYSGNYNRKIDYWSMGIIAYELCCGILPFIPHQKIFNILEQLRFKPFASISITEDLFKSENFHFVNVLPAEQRLSKSFQENITLWLRIALDIDYRRRGTFDGNTINTETPQFYPMLDKVIHMRILRIFCLNTRIFLLYELNDNLKVFDLRKLIEQDTGLPADMIFFIPPTGHPYKLSITEETHATELFVADWQDPMEPGIPPAMLYIVGYQCDYKTPENPEMSEIIKYHINLPSTNNLESWKLHRFILSTHFLLSTEQLLLAAQMNGLKEYALLLEHYNFHFKANISLLIRNMLITSGRIHQFKIMVETGKSISKPNFANFYSKWTTTVEEYEKYFQNIEIAMKKIEEKSDSVTRNIKPVATSAFFDELIAKDIYNVKSFRSELLSPPQASQKSKMEFDRCLQAFYDCLKNRYDFHQHANVKHLCDVISTMHKLYNGINEASKTAQKELSNLMTKLKEDTSSYNKELQNFCDLTLSMQTLRIDGGTTFNNDFTDAMLKMPTKELIADACKLTDLMTMEIDDNVSNSVKQANGVI